jgi:hypothetical protein
MEAKSAQAKKEAVRVAPRSPKVRTSPADPIVRALKAQLAKVRFSNLGPTRSHACTR